MKGIISNPNIAPHIKENVLAYQQSGLLKNFFTTFIEHPKYPLSRILMFFFPHLTKEFKRRSFEELSYNLVKTKPYRELFRVFSSRKLNALFTDRIWEQNELSFDSWVAKNLNRDLDFVHVTEHAALATLKRAKSLGITSFHEQPSIHHTVFSKIINGQLKTYTDFNSESIQLLYDSNSIRRNQRRDEELLLADYVICNSTFTKKSLVIAGVKEQKILVIPLGFPEVEHHYSASKNTSKIIFLAAGNLSVGKGSHILIEAWKEMQSLPSGAELWFVGQNNLPVTFMKGLPDTIKFFGNIPRPDLMKMYTKAHVLIHPTLADGFGMVISEAMSCGLPVITTFNSAGPDIIEPYKNGLLINSNDKSAIQKSVVWCIENKYKLGEMGRQALHKAESYPWSAYRTILAATVQEVLNK
ncbi:glycosyltransferase family 4 protein [Pedobacter psychrotolerans]|uniref:glycosyltransferase family 4 protein n=1 Tax=Pedobacter psychrotolerans TaxID=1843235 RepID=UPI003F97D872